MVVADTKKEVVKELLKKYKDTKKSEVIDMNKVIITEKYPIKLWLDDIEDGALQQARDLANLPFVHKWVSLMADSHQGYGMPIGGVLATNGVVIPNAVGVDIGCGMCAVKTSLKSDEININEIKEIMGSVREDIPVGFNHHKEPQKWEGFANTPHTPFIQNLIESASYQLGTLGGGNHFIEIQKGTFGFIWFMIHSGSRNFGYKIANEFHNIAVDLCRKWYSDIPNKDLSFLPIGTQEGRDYFNTMNFALSFAKENRKQMADKVKANFSKVFKKIKFVDTIDVHHNYANWENHYGKNVIVHRKGAISAREGEVGIIPGSQGTKSYIVKGLGNPESFDSCSHGAGRRMSRSKACKELSLKDEIKKLDDQGIVHGIRHTSDLDEASGAYKDINVVMENQKDLISIETELTPLAVIKG